MKFYAETLVGDISLRNKIKLYKKRAQEMEIYLSKRPREWEKFQDDFNQEVDAIFRDIMNFERVSLSKGLEEKVSKLKQIFVGKIRPIFVRGEYISWSLHKPYGYAGDYKIIDDIYRNSPQTQGFDRLFDNYFQASAISVAVRNRKDDFKRKVLDFVKREYNRPLRIMNLASGPCRDLQEMLSVNGTQCNNVTFDCYDQDEKALVFAKNLLADQSNVNFIKENALRIAFRKNITSLIKNKYDLIYSAGLFDYFNEKVASRTIHGLRNLLTENGILLIANVREKYSNPSVHFMEWVGDWNLVYRDDDAFRNIFIDAGFKKSELKLEYEQQGIMQYITASHKN